MKQAFIFLLVFFGILLLCADSPDMDMFIVSKIMGALLVSTGCVFIPNNWWK